MNKLKHIPIPDDASKHLDDLKKLGNGNKPDVNISDTNKLDSKSIEIILPFSTPFSTKYSTANSLHFNCFYSQIS